MRRRFGWIVAAFATAAACHSASVAVSGATIDWVGRLVKPLGRNYNGTFSDAIYWSTGTVPGTADTAQFNANASYTVTFTNPAATGPLIVSAGGVTFDTSNAVIYTASSVDVSGNLTLNPMILGSQGAVTVNGLGAGLTVDAGSRLETNGGISIGTGVSLIQALSGTVTVTGANAIAAMSGGSLTIGSSTAGGLRGSAGVLHVDNGGTFDATAGAIAVNPLGTVNLTGGTLNVSTDAMTITGGELQTDSAGKLSLLSGTTLTVRSGGRVDLNTSGGQELDGVNVLVTDANSHFNDSTNLYVGGHGQSSMMTWQNNATGALGGLFVGSSTFANSKGNVQILSGASVTSTKTGVADFPANAASGTITISGGTLTAGQLTVGTVGLSTGLVNLSGGILITPDAAVVESTGTISLNSGSKFFVQGYLDVNGSLNADSSSTLQLPAGGSLSIALGKVDLNGPVNASGTTILVNGGHLNLSQAPLLDNQPMEMATGSITYENGATGTLAGGLQLGVANSINAHSFASVLSGAHVSAGNIEVGTGGQTGQTGRLTVSGNGSSVISGNLAIGANANSTGLLHVDSGGSFDALVTTVNPTGTLNITGGGFAAPSLSVTGGTVQSDPAGTVAVNSLMVQNGGRVDLNGALSALSFSLQLTVDGAASHLNLAQPLTLGGNLANGVVIFQNGAVGNLAGGLNLDESFNSNGIATIQTGAHVTAGNIGVGADGNSTNSTPLLNVTGAGSSLTQSGAATLTVGAFGAGRSVGLMKVQDGGTFTSGSGPTLVSVNSELDVLGGTYNADGDITFSASTFKQDAAGTFNLAAEKTITFKNDAMVNLDGSFTGGNVDNEVSVKVNGGAMRVQSIDGAGDLTLAAAARLATDHIRQASLTLSGTALVRPQPTPNSDSSASILNRLTISGTGQLDLKNNRLTITYQAGNSPAADIRSYLSSGYDKGAWDGPGLITSMGDASHVALGYADSTDGAVAGLPANTVVVRLARYGDANLDGVVGFDDLLALAQHYGTPTARWDAGDFNYDGSVGFDDLLLLAQNYGSTLLVGAGPALGDQPATTPVPAPTATGLLLFATSLPLFARRRLA